MAARSYEEAIDFAEEALVGALAGYVEAHRSHIDQVERALRAVGRTLVVDDRAIVQDVRAGAASP